ncbi:kinesin family protein [Niveomyces insectorum RCEF 264]|uniref:Kinesin-like protein n=1 Tax=Niveomyces insectorum RCEF 264 TaxID=1081102 RepID=A0A167TC07_9HYPO|nr:kinesin family protein [Niveomyces insectorum RCEF 264]
MAGPAVAAATAASTPARAVHSSASTPSLRSRDGTVPPHARMDPGGNVRVVVRVRAFLPRETEKNTPCLIRMDPITQTTTLLAPQSAGMERAGTPGDRASSSASSSSLTPTAGFAKAANRRANLEDRSFTFDNSFWSHDPADAHYATQEDVYNSLGEEFLDHNFEGYHTCIFAYGQTGSGKSYTMMGTPAQPGLIPRTCEDLFQRIAAAQEESPNIAYNVRVSYFEVYNEHVRDLLVPPGAVPPHQPPYYLKIRESPTEGPYVKDLTDVPVRSLDEILRYMQMGDRSRTTASTKMNDTSSRSHAVFTILLRQIHHDAATDETTERSSRIRLVDLAGSERAKATEATGQRLREGSNINKSLTTLGRVIAALAEPAAAGRPARGAGATGHDRRKRRGGTPSGGDSAAAAVVPYRDSILTWLLKDSLGGNSKTAMLACIAPGDYDETLSTLRYADQAKRIRTRAVVNQDSISTAERDAQIAAMAEEIRRLQRQLADGSSSAADTVSHQRRAESDLQKQLQQEARLVEEYQTRVAAMQRMTEEKTLVAEGRIRSLQTENEALRLHLKLALDALKNPISVGPVVGGEASHSRRVVSGRRTSGRRPRLSLDPSGGLVAEDVEEGEMVESVPPPPTKAKHGDAPGKDDLVDEAYYDEEDEDGDGDDDGTMDDSADDDEHADAMEEYMQSLLADLGLFRRKIGDDKQRFIGGDALGGGRGTAAGRQPLTPRVNV